MTEQADFLAKAAQPCGIFGCICDWWVDITGLTISYIL
jgi:hypothetical protein